MINLLSLTLSSGARIFLLTQLFSTLVFAGSGFSKPDRDSYPRRCFNKYQSLKGSPTTRMRALKNLFKAADNKHSEAMNELVKYVDLTSTGTKQELKDYQLLIKRLVGQKNSFAAYFAVEMTPRNQKPAPKLINLMESTKNPFYLTKIAVGWSDADIDILNQAAAQGFYPAMYKKAYALYLRVCAGNANKAELPADDQELVESESIARFLANNSYSDGMILLIKILNEVHVFRRDASEPRSWVEKLVRQKKDALSYALLAKEEILASNWVLAETYLAKAKETLKKERATVDKNTQHEVESAEKFLKAMKDFSTYTENVRKGEGTSCSVAPIPSSKMNALIKPPAKEEKMSTVVCEVNCFMKVIRKKNSEYEKFFTRLERLSKKLAEDEFSNEAQLDLDTQPSLSDEIEVLTDTRPSQSLASSARASIDDDSSHENSDGHENEDSCLAAANSTLTEDEQEPAASFEGTYKDYPRKNKKFKGRPALQPQEAEHVDPNIEIFKELGAKLKDELDIVEVVLKGKKALTGKELRRVLNALGVQKPSNVRGSHNKTSLTLANKSTSINVITPHQKSSPHTNTNTLKNALNQFGIYTIDQLRSQTI